MIVYRIALVMSLVYSGCFANSVFAESTSLITDRPGATDSSYVVEVARVQLETAPRLTLEPGANRIDLSSVFRLGVLENVELRLGGDVPAVFMSSPLSGEVGISALSVGGKAQLRDVEGIFPSLGVLVQLELPAQTGPFSSSGTSAAFKMLADWSVADFGVSINAAAAYASSDVGVDAAYLFPHAAVFSWVLPVFEKRVSLYTDVSGSVSTRTEDDYALQVGCGSTWLVHRNLQLDVMSQFGITENVPDAQLSIGLSWRSPTLWPSI